MNYEKKQRIYKTIMLLVVTITITIIATAVCIYKFLSGNEKVKYVTISNNESKLVSEISRLKNIVDKFYLGDIDEQKLLDSTLKGYISGLNDEYSEYIPKTDTEEFSANTMGNYNGIGIYFGRLITSGEAAVISTIKNSPAYDAGILSGDIILKVNDEEITESQSLTEISNKIKGDIGTTVKITIRRGEEIKEFDITRKNIKLHQIETKVFENNIGYIEIPSFDEDTAKQFEEKYEELKNKGITSLIIDLRDNGGGIVQEATEIADLMLKKDSNILIIKDKDNKEEIKKAKKEQIIDMPIILLTNEYTASASEILAGALKDNNVAKLVGTKTYGKGVIQNVFSLSDGSVLKLTTSEYLTPNYNKINHLGIEPDIQVELPKLDEESTIKLTDENDTQLQKAIELLK